nr:hypothetical protein Iba_scaffold19156CG0010 [Ipomoea batatas]
MKNRDKILTFHLLADEEQLQILREATNFFFDLAARDLEKNGVERLGEVFNGGQSATELVSTSSVAAYGLPPALRGRLDRWLLPCSTAGALLFIDFLAAHQSLDSRLYSQLAGHQSPPALRASLLTGHLRA